MRLSPLLGLVARCAVSEWFMAQWSARTLIRPHGSYGSDHPDVARDLNNLALLLQATNRSSEAEPLVRRALAIDEKSYGPDHPTVAYGSTTSPGCCGPPTG